jgi:hypothetical protein
MFVGERERDNGINCNTNCRLEVSSVWQKNDNASAGNRTRAARVAGEHSTTEPPMLDKNNITIFDQKPTQSQKFFDYNFSMFILVFFFRQRLNQTPTIKRYQSSKNKQKIHFYRCH